LNTRILSSSEEANLKVIRGAVGDFALLYITQTGLNKNILDATLPVRTLLRSKKIHDFSLQSQGILNKKIVQGYVIEDSARFELDVSLYRPETKLGDPRLWPSRFSNYSNPDDVISLFTINERLCFVNLTRSNLSADIANGKSTFAVNLILSLSDKSSKNSLELVSLLREIAGKGLLKASCRGSTAIGRSIEKELGISMNSSQNPDYKGIELKSFRASKPSGGLITLFSKVPDWKRSKIKKSADFLDSYGYLDVTTNRKQLYCSVYCDSGNTLGFSIKINVTAGDLEQYHKDSKNAPVAVWAMDTLHNDFSKKHAETFWIKAKTIIGKDGYEWFDLKSVIHTKKPILSQFDALILSRRLCVDLTIHQEGRSVQDHGYLFRVKKECFTELFAGDPSVYDLK